MRQRLQVILRWRLDNRNSPQLRGPVNKQLLLSTGGASGVDHNVLGVAWCLAEKIEYGDPVVGMRLAEGVAADVNVGYIRYASEASNLGGVGQPVVSEVNALQR